MSLFVMRFPADFAFLSFFNKSILVLLDDSNFESIHQIIIILKSTSIT